LAHGARARHPYFGIAGTIFLLVHIPFSYPDQVLRIITRDLPAYQQLYDNRLATLPASRASAPRSSLGASWRSGTRPYEDRRVGHLTGAARHEADNDGSFIRPAARCANRPTTVHDRARRAVRSPQRATAAEDGSQARRAAFLVGLHTVRHSAASVMLSAGVPLKVSGRCSVTRASRSRETSTRRQSRGFLGRRWLGPATHSHQSRRSNKVVKREDDLETGLFRVQPEPLIRFARSDHQFGAHIMI